jgi:hypothetical protein
VLPYIHHGDGVVGRYPAANDPIESCGFTEANSVLLISRIGEELSRASVVTKKYRSVVGGIFFLSRRLCIFFSLDP